VPGRQESDERKIKNTRVLLSSVAMKGSSLGPQPVTTDQFLMLQKDNICNMHDCRDARGIEPITFRTGSISF